MKFLGNLFFLAVNFCAVLSIPTNFHDSTFHYWYTPEGTKATIVGVYDTSLRTVTIKPFITINNKRYYVNQVGAGAFSNTIVENIIVNGPNAYEKDEFVESINFSPNAFQNAKSIRKIEVNTEKVTADPGAFDGCSTNLYFTGKGTLSLANSMAKNYLTSWNLPITKDYTNETPTVIMNALYNLAKRVKENFSVNSKIAYPSNPAVVFALRTGDSTGIAKIYRLLALNMGFQYNDVHVGSDNAYYSFNYVYINRDNTSKKWYNLDIVNTTFGSNVTYRVFRTNAEESTALSIAYGGKTINPDNWVIYVGEEIAMPSPENFNNWLIRNIQGVRV